MLDGSQIEKLKHTTRLRAEEAGYKVIAVQASIASGDTVGPELTLLTLRASKDPGASLSSCLTGEQLEYLDPDIAADVLVTRLTYNPREPHTLGGAPGLEYGKDSESFQACQGLCAVVIELRHDAFPWYVMCDQTKVMVAEGVAGSRGQARAAAVDACVADGVYHDALHYVHARLLGLDND